MGLPEFSRTRVQNPDGDGGWIAYEAKCACGVTGHVKIGKPSGSLPREIVARSLANEGWTFTRRGATCPVCNETEKAMSSNVHSLKADQPRQMGQGDRRRVFRAIDDYWDERSARYQGGTTDKSIAEKLGVPRAWVETIRIEAFGDTGRNEDLDKVIGTLKNLQGEARRLADNALEMAAKYEDYEKRIAEALAKAEKLI